MKRIALAAVLAAALISFSSSAFALSFSVDVPYQFTFAKSHLNTDKDAKPKDKSTTDVEGMILTATAGWFGVGYERYEMNAEGKGGDGSPFDLRVTYQFYDLVVDLPMPVLNVVLGYGVGTFNTQLSGSDDLPTIDSSDATQLFARLGLPIGKVFDLHVGYHVITTEPAKFKNMGGSDEFVADGTLLTVGVRAGW